MKYNYVNHGCILLQRPFSDIYMIWTPKRLFLCLSLIFVHRMNLNIIVIVSEGPNRTQYELPQNHEELQVEEINMAKGRKMD